VAYPRRSYIRSPGGPGLYPYPLGEEGWSPRRNSARDVAGGDDLCRRGKSGGKGKKTPTKEADVGAAKKEKSSKEESSSKAPPTAPKGKGTRSLGNRKKDGPKGPLSKSS